MSAGACQVSLALGLSDGPSFGGRPSCGLVIVLLVVILFLGLAFVFLVIVGERQRTGAEKQARAQGDRKEFLHEKVFGPLDGALKNFL
ncbi:MAG: hypothetical protein FJW31_02910 [Acidobacteria bacterium]|nr:hypothetical protein [Acidobacteriota bacterium]